MNIEGKNTYQVFPKELMMAYATLLRDTGAPKTVSDHDWRSIIIANMTPTESCSIERQRTEGDVRQLLNRLTDDDYNIAIFIAIILFGAPIFDNNLTAVMAEVTADRAAFTAQQAAAVALVNKSRVIPSRSWLKTGSKLLFIWWRHLVAAIGGTIYIDFSSAACVISGGAI